MINKNNIKFSTLTSIKKTIDPLRNERIREFKIQNNILTKFSKVSCSYNEKTDSILPELTNRSNKINIELQNLEKNSLSELPSIYQKKT